MQQLSSYRMNERGHRISLKKIVEHFVYFNSATRVMATQRKANHDNISHNLQKKNNSITDISFNLHKKAKFRDWEFHFFFILREPSRLQSRLDELIYKQKILFT